MNTIYTWILISFISIFTLKGQEKVRIYGQVTDVNDIPVDSASVWLKQNIDSLSGGKKSEIFENSYETFTDENGFFSMEIKPGTYYCLYAIKEVLYRKTKLEYWAWNLPIYQDLNINPKYDRIEIYGINAFEPQRDPFNTYVIYFRPMSLTKVLSLPKELKSDTINIAPENITVDELSIRVNNVEAKVVGIDKVKEYIDDGKFLISYLVQILKPDTSLFKYNSPELIKGFDKITIELNSKETNEFGKGEYFLKKIGD